MRHTKNILLGFNDEFSWTTALRIFLPRNFPHSSYPRTFTPYNFPQIIPPGQLSPEQLPQLKFPRASAPQVFACEQFPLNNFPWTTNPQAIAPLKFSPGQLPQNNFPSRQLLIFVSNRVVLSLDFTLAKQVVQPGILRGIINLSLELWQYSTYFHQCCY